MSIVLLFIPQTKFMLPDTSEIIRFRSFIAESRHHTFCLSKHIDQRHMFFLSELFHDCRIFAMSTDKEPMGIEFPPRDGGQENWYRRFITCFKINFPEIIFIIRTRCSKP